MRSTRRIARRAIVMLFASFAGCANFTLAPREVSAPVPAPVKTAPPVANPAKAEPTVNAESRQMYQQALTALGAGRYSEAERALLAVIRREPELAGPRANLGILYARTGHPVQAFESLKQAIRLNPDRAAYYNELGMVSRREGHAALPALPGARAGRGRNGDEMDRRSAAARPRRRAGQRR